MNKRLFLRGCFLALVLALALPSAAHAAGELSVTLPETLTLTLGTEQSVAGVDVQLPSGTTADKLQWDWVSRDRSIFRVSAGADTRSPTLRPEKAGSALLAVTASIPDNDDPHYYHTATRECSVTVQYAAPTGLSVLPVSTEVEVEETVTLSGVPAPSALTDAGQVRWGIDRGTATGEVTLSASRGNSVRVTGVKPGKVTINAQVEGVDPTGAAVTHTAASTITVTGIVITNDGIVDGVLTIAQGSEALLGITPFGEDLEHSSFPVEWTSGSDSVAFVSAQGERAAKVVAQTVGSTVVTALLEGNEARVEIRVVENTANTIKRNLVSGSTLKLGDLLTDLRQTASDATGGGKLLCLANLMVDTKQGTLYYDYVSSADHGYGVGTTERYYVSPSAGQRGLEDVTFVPETDFVGTATIRYNGYDDGNKSFSGLIQLNITGSAEISYSISANQPLTFETADFSAVCREVTGRDLDYVTFELPRANRGTLYFNFISASQYAEPVTATERYYRTRSPKLESVTFLPAQDYVGTFRLIYRGTDTSGVGYSGRVAITVSSQDDAGSGDVEYTADQGERVRFSAADFNAACRDTIFETLDCVRFDLPDSTVGTLYYNYRANGAYDSKVTASRWYNRTGSPSISNISFVPASGITGTVAISFTGYGQEEGEQFTGRVLIRYPERGGGSGEVEYTGEAGKEISFNAADFNTACQTENGAALDYVRFSLPNSSVGTLYYNYTGSSGSRVTSTAKYYRSGSPALSNVSFVPKSGTSGTVYIDFTGFDAAGYSFGGQVRVTVKEAGSTTRLYYTMVSGGALDMDAVDLNGISQTVAESSLNYVRFSLPASSKGTLYYQYDREDGSYASKVSASTSYYRTGGTRLLEHVTFVASSSYQGTVEIPYTGRAANGREIEGVIYIQVSAPVAQTIRYAATSTPVRLYAADLRQAFRAVMGRELSYIRFTSLPLSTQGKVYISYTRPGVGTLAMAGANYYDNGSPGLEGLCFVPRAGFNGRINLPYTAYDARGEQLSGTVEIAVVPNLLSGLFNDMGSYSWAVSAVDFLNQAGVVSGVGNSRYGPSSPVKRGDFVLMLCGAFGFETTSADSGFSDVPASSYYARAVTAARNLGIAAGSSGLFLPERPLTRQDAMVMLHRAMARAGYNLPSASMSTLSAYQDQDQIADYAREAAAALVQMGAVGGSNGRLNPRSPINRAEMAVILHQILTM